jgi:pimeloyl-ACP methyl ester carboxylesterase
MAAGAAAVGSGRKASAQTVSPRTFVLVPGAWHGGWCWRDVAAMLRSAGHTVYTATQTGLGERSHLLSRNITVDTFVDDVANLIRWEQIEQVVLVGHSFGGLSISGVADRMPERLRQLVYLDSLILEDGQTPFSVTSTINLYISNASSEPGSERDSGDVHTLLCGGIRAGCQVIRMGAQPRLADR